MKLTDVRIEIVGTSPMLCHNIALSDPENEYAKQISLITSKRKKTDEDRKAIERLEWFGGLYTAHEEGMMGPVLPTRCIRKAVVEAAKVNRLGKSVTRALLFKDVHIPIAYDGPRDLEQLFQDKKYHNRASVSVNKARIMRVRPCFPKWSIIADATLIEDALDFDDLNRIINLAGQIEGLGDNRVNGYGRFEATVKVLEGAR